MRVCSFFVAKHATKASGGQFLSDTDRFVNAPYHKSALHVVLPLCEIRDKNMKNRIYSGRTKKYNNM